MEREGEVAERLFQIHKVKKENLERAREAAEKELEEKYNFKPNISTKAKITTGREDIATVNKEWIQQRDAKLEQKRRQLEEEEAGQLTSPTLSKGTQLIVTRMKNRQARNLSHEDSLVSKQQQAKQAFLDKIECEYRNKNPGTPRITSAAAKIQRTGEISERLYQLSFDLKERKDKLAKERLLEEKRKYRFRPQINHAELTRIFPTESDYLRRKTEKRAYQQSNFEKEWMYQPQLNPVSVEIAARLPQTTKDRLFQAKVTAVKEYHDPSCTFSPKINEKSRDLVAERDVQHNIVEDLYSKEQRRQKKLKDLRREKEERELRECTFSPRTRDEKTESEWESGSLVRGSDIIERARKWKKRREEKLRREREEQQKKEMEECTFQPNLSRNRDSLSTTMDSVQSNSTDPLGFSEFIERQESARRKREQEWRNVFTTGEKWRPQPTTPKEFKLGRSMLSTSTLKALAKPMSPPSFKERSMLNLSEEWSDDEADGLSLPPSGTFSRLATSEILSQCNLSEIQHVPEENTTDSLALDTRHKTVFSISFNHIVPSSEWMRRHEEKQVAESELS